MDPRRRALLAFLAAGAAVRPALAQDSIMTKQIPSTRRSAADHRRRHLADLRRRRRRRRPRPAARSAEAPETATSSIPRRCTAAPRAVAGDLIAELGMRDKLFIATKVWTNGRDAGIAADGDLLQAPARRAHGPHAGAQPGRRRRRTPRRCWTGRTKKRVRYIGITHYTSSAYAEVERLLKTRAVRLPADQLLARRARIREQRCLPLAQETEDRGHRQPPVRRRRAVPARRRASRCRRGRPSSASRAGRSTSSSGSCRTPR